MKISITQHGTTCSVETQHDELTIDEVVEHIKGLLVASGYHPESVDNHIKDVNSWFDNDMDSRVEQFQDNMYKS